jgi:succinoglycan biosynthesis protein ExoA
MVWAVFCLSYGFFLGSKAGDMRIALAGPAAMIMHLGWSLGFWKAVLVLWGRRK